jgi:hypothetical protein
MHIVMKSSVLGLAALFVLGCSAGRAGNAKPVDVGSDLLWTSRFEGNNFGGDTEEQRCRKWSKAEWVLCIGITEIA